MIGKTSGHLPSDEARVEEFAGRLIETYTAGVVGLMIDVAYRTGLFEALTTGPATSTQLAERARLTERYVRECLAALVTGDVAPRSTRSSPSTRSTTR